MTPRPKPAGFTLLELVLMLGLLAVLAAAGMSWYFERSSVTLHNAGKLLIEDLHIAQQRASFASDETRVTFATSGYRIANSSGILIQNPRTGQLFERDYGRDAVFQGVNIEGVDFNGLKELVFDAAGVPSSVGSVRLVFEGHRLAIEIDPSGFATLVDLPSEADQAPVLAPQAAR